MQQRDDLGQQFRYNKTNLAPRLRGKKQKQLFIPQPRCDLFCFIPLNLEANLELQ